MHTTINIPLVDTQCPDGQTEKTCRVRKCLREESELFHETVNENVFSLAQPYLDGRVKYEFSFAKLVKECEICKRENRQR